MHLKIAMNIIRIRGVWIGEDPLPKEKSLAFAICYGACTPKTNFRSEQKFACSARALRPPCKLILVGIIEIVDANYKY